MTEEQTGVGIKSSVTEAREAVKSLRSGSEDTSVPKAVTLDQLFNRVLDRVEDTLKQMAKSQEALSPHETNIYIKINDILLNLCHWRDDIKVDTANALLTVEEDTAGFGILAASLRTCLDTMLETLACLGSEKSIVVDSDCSPIDDLVTLAAHLRTFVRPLRTYLEAKAGVGSVATIRKAAASYTQKLPMRIASIVPSDLPPVNPKRTRPRRKKRSLAEEIPRYFKKSVFDSGPARLFAPAGTIEQLVVPDTVRTALELNQGDEEDLVRFIIDQAITLFAITCHIGLHAEDLFDAMQIFMENNILDKKLPIIHSTEALERARQSYQATASGDQDLSRNAESLLTQIDPAEYLWTFAKRTEFYNKQWSFLAPIFSTGEENLDLTEAVILPFIQKDEEIKTGGFGEVFKVAIDEEHIKDPKNTLHGLPEFYAIKKIIPRTKEQQVVIENWTKEVINLRQAAQLNEDHIVRFITAFRRGDEGKRGHYLIFEWAHGGSLRDLWNRIGSPKLNPQLVEEMTMQLLGLAKAINAVHYPSTNVTKDEGMLHGDLKPENILCFPGEGVLGTWKIGDWGLAKPKDSATIHGNEITRSRATVRYEPPESRTGVRVKGQIQPLITRSRLFDVWAMGCIIFETIIWCLEGIDGLKNFYHALAPMNVDVAYFQMGPSLGSTKPELRKAVIVWMDSLANHAACAKDTALGDLLELIKIRLLVVRLPKDLAALGLERSSTVHKDKGHSDATDPESARGLSALGSPQPTSKETAAGITLTVTQDDADDFNTLVKSTDSEEEQEPCRYRADQLKDELEGILGKSRKTSSYWLIETPMHVVPFEDFPVPSLTYTSLERLSSLASGTTGESSFRPSNTSPLIMFPDSGDYSGTPSTSQAETQVKITKTGLLAVQKQQDYVSEDPIYQHLDSDWITQVDNEFANHLFSAIRHSKLSGLPPLRSPPQLCEACKSLDLWRLAFRVQLIMDDLRKKASQCDLCRLFLDTCKKKGVGGFRTVTITRVDSWLKMNSSDTPALFLCRPLESKEPTEVQVGAPFLADPLSEAHIEVMRQWLKLCDEKHDHQDVKGHHSGISKDAKLPTRLIDVGENTDGDVKLWETNSGDRGRYIVLSHPWGEPPHFCTFRNNLAEHKRGIPLQHLPATFRDAVRTTRALKLRYLWIDSICIIQGQDGDFKIEVKRMEQVFSAAYCVIAASFVRNQVDGFLKPRYERDYVALDRDERHRLYVCEIIDDFNRHSLESNLSNRCWALQEHALAHRTIFFTKYQTYFECGDGVRCETGTKMSNSLAAFLGDSNFPQMIMSASKGERIVRYQDLYKRYSRLALSNDFDRPYALDGLEARLLKAFDTEGGLGIFDEGPAPRQGHLRRSLLWSRGEDVKMMKRIVFPADRSMVVPSWSWMAYNGGIDYLDLKFNEVIWKDLRSPWKRNAWGSRSRPMPKDPNGGFMLGGMAQDFDLSKGNAAEVKLIYDRPEEAATPRLKCVVLGVKIESIPYDVRRNYVLIIAPLDGKGEAWERVGAGYLPEKCISSSGSPVVIR